MKKSSFIEGTIIATFAIIFVKILGMLYVIPFYSIIGSQGSSLYSYAYNIYLIFLSISSAGIPVAISKIVSEYESSNLHEAKVRSFKIGITIVSILSVVCFLILIFFSKDIAYLIIGDTTGGNSINDIEMMIRVVSLSLLVVPFLSVAKGYLQGHKFIKPSSVSQMLEQILRIAVILLGSYYVVKILNKPVSLGVAVAVFGSFVGGIVATVYILKKLLDNKKELNLDEKSKKDNISNKTIIKKIIKYAVPFIVINVTVNIYNTVDMSLIIRTLSHLGFSGIDAEFVASTVTTWGYKLNMIITAMATGLTVSLIPNIVQAYTKKDNKRVNDIINKAFQIIILVSVPATIGLSFLSAPVWTVFYGSNQLGATVFRMSIITAVFSNIYLVSIQTAQSLNKYKTVYFAVLIGFFANALLDVPVMLLFNLLSLPAYWGAAVATMIGYSLAIIIVTKSLKTIEGVSYKRTYLIARKIIVNTIIMVVILFGLKLLLPFASSSRYMSLIYIIIYSLTGGIIYMLLCLKQGLIKELFGEKIYNKVIKILTFGKAKGSDHK